MKCIGTDAPWQSTTSWSEVISGKVSGIYELVTQGTQIVSMTYTKKSNGKVYYFGNNTSVDSSLESGCEWAQGEYMRSKTLAVSLLGLLWTMPVLAETTTFIPTKGVEAKLVLEGSTLNVAVKGETHNESRTIDFETVNELHMQVDDFDFDGAKDFAVRQLDDGMGTYDYYRVLIYQAKTGTFEELQPDCGVGFVNLRVDKKRKASLSTYWEMNIPKQCVTRFAKRKA